MTRLPRAIAAVPFALLITGAGLVGTATADTGGVPAPISNGFGRPQVLQCGAKVSTDTILAADIGPCPPQTDGIDVVASGIRLNLNGHTITGTDTTNATNSEQVGVNLKNVQGVDLSGPGTITAFDAGVGVNGGSGNSVRLLLVHDNIAHVVLTGGVSQTNPEATACNYGDGIITDNSSGNTITGNTATHNGPFDGIALVDASTSNTVFNNTTTDQTVPNMVPSGAGGPCGPFGATTTGPGRPHQDIGIRMEGPGAANNVIDHNNVSTSMLDGISVFDNICAGNPRGVPPTAPNSGNLVENNTSSNNGFAGPGEYRDGIAIVSQGPTLVDCIPSNNSFVNNVANGNARDGIFLGGRGSHNNTVTGNTTDGNGLGAVTAPALPGDGIHLNGPAGGLPGAVSDTITGNEAHGNANVDGFDGNPNCDANNWANNLFQFVNQSCVDPSATVRP